MTRGALCVLGIGATAVALLFAAWLGISGAAASSVLLAIAVACLPYALVVAVDPFCAPLRASRSAITVATLVGLVLVAAPPVLSDDVYRYLWEGKLWAHGFSPYQYSPDHVALAHLRDAQWDLINNRELATIYPPVAQALFFLVASTGCGVWGFKLFALVVHLLTTHIVSRIAGPLGARAAFAFALNPLALTESAMNGHIDIVAGFLLVACAWALFQELQTRASLLVAAAVGVKLIGFALLPLFKRRALVVAFGLSALMLAPLLWVTPLDASRSGTTEYAVRWKGNEGGFRLVEAGVRELVERTETNDAYLVTALTARGLVVVAILGLGSALTRRCVSPLLAARWVLLVGLLFAPQVHPWYLLWLIPIEVALGRYAVLVWSVTALVAYTPIDLWLAHRQWVQHDGAVAFEYGAVVLALMIEGFPANKGPDHGVL